MGLFFKSEEEKEEARAKKEAKREKSVLYMGTALQNIGPILQNASVGITMDPENQRVRIHNQKNDIYLPYDRILGFSINKDTELVSGKISVGGAIVGAALLGPAGAILGGLSKKNKNKINWIGTLLYKDKDGNDSELNFLTDTIGKAEKKTDAMINFENAMNNVASKKFKDMEFEL